MFDLLQHPALIVGVFDLLHLDNLSLFQDLDGIEALVVLGLDQVHSAEASSAQGPADGEVSEGVFALCFPHGVRCRLAGDWRSDGAIGVGRIGLRRGIDDVLDASGVWRMLCRLLLELLLAWLQLRL